MPGKGKLDRHGAARRRDEGVRPGRADLGARARATGSSDDWFATHDVHVHVPAGAVPKDGPSAGITMATALVSLITARPVRGDTAMTGEITLTGQVLPIGGLKEKALAAQRAGITRVIAPLRNEPDLEDLPAAPARRRWSSSGRARSSDVLDAALEPPANGAVEPPGADPGRPHRQRRPAR